MSARTEAARTISGLLRKGESLSTLLPQSLKRVPEKDRGLYQELCYGTLRWYPKLECYLAELLNKPFKPKDFDIQALLACALYQLSATRIPPHAAVNESVTCCDELKKPWAKGLVNAVLRRFQREQVNLDRILAARPAFKYAHPDWLLEAWLADWPEAFESLIEANNQRPPMTLRVNRLQISRQDYLQKLIAAGIGATETEFSQDGLLLDHPQDVSSLPGFAEGMVSIQDEAAQLAAQLLQLQPAQRVLDACCAPGGKTCHILEQLGRCGEVTAVDVDESRLGRVEENLQRLQLSARLIAADAASLSSWWNGEPFDRVLLDAPCSATGVIRRHPDIKLLRKPEDIPRLVETQLQLLKILWTTLKPGGIMLYATCSTLPQENDGVIERFLRQTKDAELHHPLLRCGFRTAAGQQLLPQVNGHDGFYYARLSKAEYGVATSHQTGPYRE